MLVWTLPASGQELVVDGSGSLGPTSFHIDDSAQRRYDHVCVINGGTVTVESYDGAGDKALLGNLELIAGSVYVDASSRIDARGSGYQPRKCYHGGGPTQDAGGRGGCGVADSGGGGAHFGGGGRGTIDGPTDYPTHFEDNCDDCSSGTCTHTWNEGANACDSSAACGVDDNPCPGGRGGRICKIGPTVAGQPFWHNIYDPEFGAAGGDKGCRDNHGYTPVTGGAGGGRVVLVGLSHLTSTGDATCGLGLSPGEVRIDGEIDAAGHRGCGIGNDSGGGGAGGTVLVVGEQVAIGDGAAISAAGGLGGDTFAAAVGQPDYQDCVAGAQTGGTCDDCGGGGGGGIISVLSVASSIDPLADFNVGGALGGVCPVCNGEAGGGAGELQLDGAYVGEFCDGFDNDFDGAVDEDLGQQSCGLGGCAQDIDACSAGVPVTCSPMVEPTDPTCSADPDGARPRIAVVLDTSASMLLSLDGYPTFGDGSVDHPGVDTDGDLQPNDSRMFLAREALAQVTSAYPEIDFALARYHQNQSVDRSCQTARWFECQDLVASYDEPADNTGAVACSAEINASDSLDVRPTSVGGEECINYAGSCGPPRRGADVLSGFGTPTRDLVRWLDGRETAFNADETPGNVCDHLGGGDCEVRATGPTPLEGSLLAVEDYVVPIRAVDPATGCRGYSVILVTDGAESCNGDPVAAAARLHGMFGIEVYVVAVSVLPQEQASLDALAMAGSGDARGATFVNAPQELVPALTDIIAGSIRSEDCNGADDDCDGAIDEDFPGLGDGCDDGNVGVCRGEGTIVCNGAGDGTECDITMPGGSPDDESCNFLDDDCDLFIDEGLSCTTTTCTELGAEICNGADDDCDGQVDEGDPDGGAACGSDEGVCEPGQTRCVAGMLRCVGGVEPTMEICDGDDDDCDGEIDDDAPCPPGNVCIDAACRRRCDPQMEFTCPVGMLCTEVTEPEQDAGSYCLPSACAVCGPGEVCDGERCVDLCEGVSCDEGDSCVDGDCRDCHFVGCPTGEVCFASECQADPCADVSCAEGEACMSGSCAASCDDADCGVGERCGEGGSCEPDPCAMVACRGAEVCIEGECSDNPCLGMQCLGGDVCVPAMGCIDDPCPLTTCPEGRSCALDVSGRVQCVSADVPVKSGARPDQGVEAEDGRFVTAAGGGLVTCAVGSASGTGSGAGMWLAGVVLFWWRRRR